MVIFIILIVMLSAWGACQVLARRLPDLDDAERFGLGGLLSLAMLGLAVFILGLALPFRDACSISFTTWIAVSAVLAFRLRPAVAPKFHANDFFASIPLLVLGALILIKVLSPSDMLDWDTLAYHFAVPKVWLQTGKMAPLDHLHQSHFPFIFDNLFGIGLMYGENCAKVFTLLGWGFGCAWIWGVSRRFWGPETGSIAAAGFAGTPLITWSSGSGYIDVVHGLYAAMAVLYGIEASKDINRSKWVVCGLCLGAALGSKYTGLQTAFLLLIAVMVVMIRTKSARKQLASFGMASAIAIVIGGGWYVRNAVDRGNPVWPFFYEQLGGRGWDQWRADLYRNEQLTFGVGRNEKRRDATAIGAGVMGLAYQPGRYVNPGQDSGQGTPLGALGFVLLTAPVAWMLLGRRNHVLLGSVAVTGGALILWFFLSQQVRYITSLAPLWALCLGGIMGVSLKLDRLLKVLVLIQVAFTTWLIFTFQTVNQLPVVGTNQQLVSFAKDAAVIDEHTPKGTRVALYNQVFGYFLNTEYLWGNPGHGQLIPYDTISSGQDFAKNLKALRFSTVYYDSRFDAMDRRAMFGYVLREKQLPPPEALTPIENNRETKWQVLIMRMIAEDQVEVIPLPEGSSGLLLKLK